LLAAYGASKDHCASGNATGALPVARERETLIAVSFPLKPRHSYLTVSNLCFPSASIATGGAPATSPGACCMRCFYHSKTDAVGIFRECGKSAMY